MKKVIAIDGPSGAGKSTIAKLIARKLGFDYLDTGALYRAVAISLIKLGLKEGASDRDIEAALQKTDVEFNDGHIFLNGDDVSSEIRSPEAGHFASVFSARKPVREFLMKTQRDSAVNADIVAEGRDVTTVVFPHAFKKFYLDASIEERKKRRSLELISKGFEVNEDRIRQEIIERDARDSGRDIAPLKKADEACLIDSSGLSIEEVINKLMGYIRDN
ncbi:MAG: cytidylate kinase [Nitrospirae bacterium GWC2_42_7]|nr:MAG: cytidylate kinase [Nitrospirae bacterium GWC2_42_7]